MSKQSDTMKRCASQDPAVRCSGKFQFATAQLAQRVAREGNRRADRNYSAYRCGNCSFWHTGTAPKGGRHHVDVKQHKRDVRAIREGEDQ